MLNSTRFCSSLGDSTSKNAHASTVKFARELIILVEEIWSSSLVPSNRVEPAVISLPSFSVNAKSLVFVVAVNVESGTLK